MAREEFIERGSRGERQPGEAAFSAQLSSDGRQVLFAIERDEGTVQLEFGRAEAVRLAQTLLAMAGVMVEG